MLIVIHIGSQPREPKRLETSTIKYQLQGNSKETVDRANSLTNPKHASKSGSIFIMALTDSAIVSVKPKLSKEARCTAICELVLLLDVTSLLCCALDACSFGFMAA